MWDWGFLGEFHVPQGAFGDTGLGGDVSEATLGFGGAPDIAYVADLTLFGGGESASEVDDIGVLVGVAVGPLAQGWITDTPEHAPRYLLEVGVGQGG